jgi:hypothetical protein
VHSRTGSGLNRWTHVACVKKKQQHSPNEGRKKNIPLMPSAPKKPSSKKTTLSPEEHTLLLKTRREAIEKRIIRNQGKIDKDSALLKKYTPIEEEAPCAACE